MGSNDGTGGRGARSHAVEFVGIATTFSGGVGVDSVMKMKEGKKASYNDTPEPAEALLEH